MMWRKIGQLFSTDGFDQLGRSWMNSHAANPIPIHLKDDLFRIYFTSRDPAQRSHITYVDMELVPPFKVHGVASEPVVAPGELGTFDDSGAALGCISRVKEKTILYYLGWNLSVTVPWRNSIGAAVLDQETGKFKRLGRAPLLDRCEVDPFSISYPFVMEDGDVIRMWYGSNLSWGAQPQDMAHVIKYAESTDGFTWNRHGVVALQLGSSDEYALSRPCVRKEEGRFLMWYSYRGPSYRIGYAESNDGRSWERKDAAVGIDVSSEGWDSEMICYPHVFEHREATYMLYNGNGYGKTGFGLAVLESGAD